MSKLENEVLNLITVHEKARKSDLIRNLNQAIMQSGIPLHGKNIWVSKITGSPIGTVFTWFSNASCKASNKIQLSSLCKIAIALNVPIWTFYETDYVEEETDEIKIDRKGQLYWYIRRNEAGKIWNSLYGRYGIWEMQSNDVQREFVDKLYLQRLEEQGCK